MPDIADYDGPSTAVIHSDADSLFAIYLARFMGDDKNTFRFNVTIETQGVRPGLCLTSKPLSPMLLAQGTAAMIRLLKSTETWPKIKEELASQLD